MAGPVAIGSNPIPAGGMTALQSVAPNSIDPNIRALIEQLTPVQARFRQQSSFLKVLLDQAQYKSGAGSSPTQKIASVGLGVGTTTKHVIVMSIVNSGGAAQTVTLSPFFPFNLVNKVDVKINGGSSVYSVGGVGSLLLQERKRRGFLRRFAGAYGPALNPALCQITVTNGTVTNAAASASSWSGIASISVAAGATCTVTCTFVTFEKFALDRDSLLGALPLQNSSTFATIQYTLANQFVTTNATDQTTPLYNAGANITVSITNDGTSYAQSLYRFATIPPDPSLYLDMVANSYQVQQQDGLSIASVSTDTPIYDVPRNAYIIALHGLMADSTKAYLSYANAGAIKLRYNAGTIIVETQDPVTFRAEQYRTYGDDPNETPGWRVWDGDDTSDSPYATDNMGWLDAYSAANPQLTTSLSSGVSVPVGLTIIREQVVAGAVQVV